MSEAKRLAPLWKFAEVSPPTPEFTNLSHNDEVTFIPLEDVWPTYAANDFQTVNWEARLTGYTPFRCGDLLLPKVTPTVTHGRTMIADITTNLGVASTEVYTIRARPCTDPRWLAYLLVGNEFLGFAGASVQGTGGLKRISTQFVESYPLPSATPDEQRAIADYLDRETAEIDGMRADLDEMERLLTERRQSVKSGLFDSSASHAAVKVKYLATINTGSGDTQDAAQDGPYSFYVRSDKVLSSDQWDFNGPAVLTAGDGAGVGKIFHYAEGKFKVHQRVYCLHDFRNVDPLYFFNAFSYLLPKEVLYGGASSTVPSLRMHMLEDLQIPLPPLAEQRRIADEIDRETAEIDSMLEDITKLRDLLAERRAAVISAAVTGQIDIPVSPTHKDEPHA